MRLIAYTLVMEQPNRLLDEADTQFSCSLEARLIVLASSRRGEVFDAGAGATIDVIGKREEGVARTCYF